MFHYRAHGLAVAANRPITELLEDRDALNPQLTILFGEHPFREAGSSDLESTWFTSPHTAPNGEPALVATKRHNQRVFRLVYADGPAFLIDANQSIIWVTWPDDLTMVETLPYLLGPVFGTFMRLCGIACLHASAVELDGQAHVFAGLEGAGKSTLAAAFACAGDRVLSDDIVTVTRRASTFVTAPGYPRVRLWPDALTALYAHDRELRAAADDAPAARHHLDLRNDDRFARDPLPIAAVYFLEYDGAASRPRIESLAPAEALPMLAVSTFAHRALDREGRIAEFQMVTDLISSVPMRRLVRAPGLERITAVCAAVRVARVDALCECGSAATRRS